MCWWSRYRKTDQIGQYLITLVLGDTNQIQKNTWHDFVSCLADTSIDIGESVHRMKISNFFAIIKYIKSYSYKKIVGTYVSHFFLNQALIDVFKLEINKNLKNN